MCQLPDGPTRNLSRKFTGQRGLRIGVRTAHIASAGIMLGAATLGVSPEAWPAMAMSTGMLLVLDDLYRYGIAWLRYAQAWAILVKLAGLAVGMANPEWLAGSLWVAMILGSFISHAPGAVRQAALWGQPGPCALKGLSKETTPPTAASPPFPTPSRRR